MRVKPVKKLFSSDDKNESSRAGLFAALLLAIVFVTGVTGFFVFNGSKNAKSSVEHQSQLYEQAKNQQNQTATHQDSEPSSAEQVEIADSAVPNVVGTALVYFSKYPGSDSNDQQIVSVERSIYDGQDAVETAIQELISGPSPAEKAEGFFGGIELKGDSNCDGADFKITADESSIKLQFCRDYSDGMASEYKISREQVIRTISGISGQTTVYVLDKNGKCLFNQSLDNC